MNERLFIFEVNLKNENPGRIYKAEKEEKQPSKKTKSHFDLGYR